MSVTINAYQSERLRKVMADEEVAAQCGERAEAMMQLRWSGRPVAGSVEVVTADGFVAAVLPPSPGPFRRDFRFQHAEPLDRSCQRLACKFVRGRLEWARDWQWEAGFGMDAPDEMPAGALQFFAADEDAFGSVQITCEREA